MSILITGGAGFIGQHLVREVCRSSSGSSSVAVLDLPGADRKALAGVDVEWLTGSITDPEFLRHAVSGRKQVYHLAADPNLWHPETDHFEKVNHQGTRNVLLACMEAGVERVVYTSTESIVRPAEESKPQDRAETSSLGKMIGPYCRSKFLAEQAALAFAAKGLNVVIVNPTVPVGPGDVNQTPPGRLLTDFLNQRIGGYLPGTVNLVDVRDVAVGHVLAMEKGKAGERYLLSGENFTWEQAFGLFSELTGLPGPWLQVPYLVALAFAHTSEIWARYVTGKSPMATVTGVRLTCQPFVFDASRTTDALGWRPRPVRESLADAIRWCVAEGLCPEPPALRDQSDTAPRDTATS